MEPSHSKLEEALEVKSLRRIISAYLNYSAAAEEDVKRYKRSFERLTHTHKALLPDFPLKCQKLRRCISVNAFFILNMLQAFQPPFDMSQDVEICGNECLENSTGDHFLPEGPTDSERNLECCGQHVSTSGRSSLSLDDTVNRSPKRRIENEEISTESFCESVTRNWPENRGNDELITHHTGPETVLVANGKVNSPPHCWLDPSLQLNVPLVDVDKVRCIIRNIVRDWAPEGQRERDQCYKPILEELDRLFPSRCKSRPPCCLVPGAGLGRLALEISCLGFVSQGNEFSYYMMICSSFILNQTRSAREWIIYPWIHSNCNSLSDNDQLRSVEIPDIHPASAGITEGFSMCGGDFVEVYNDASQEGSWDAVVTCFFLDTAHNIIQYIEIISKILKDDGVWINFGPLLYHFADSYGPEEEMSIELSLEDVKRLAFHYGFEMQMEKTIETTFSTNPCSMMQNRYFAAFWTMKKKQKTH